MRVRLGSAFALVFALLASSGVGTRADAATITFDFENQASTSTIFSHPGGLTSLALTSSGLTMTLTRPGSAFDIIDTTTFINPKFPASFGTRSLDPFSNDTSSTSFVVNFSTAVTGFSLSYGDFGGDADTASILAFSGLNGAGTLLGTGSSSYPVNSTFPDNVSTFGVTGSGIQSIVFIGGSTLGPNSVYYDNFVVTTADTAAVPEPASLALVSIAGLAFVAGRKLVRKKAVAA